ncbi:site-specific integrase [Kistimonas scapharcae]|uniref:Site-specific integrase n=1 Tax=Kistimonas scapharcae TaxID=1036133 RepID=A0ABP8UYU2_9GAMM
MGRKRGSKTTEGLPTYLYRDKDTGLYKYKHSTYSKPIYLPVGTTRRQAIEAANLANAELTQQRALIDKLLGRDQITVEKLCKEYYAEKIENTSLKQATKKSYRVALDVIKKHLGPYLLHDLSTADIASFLKQFKDRPSWHNDLRANLIKIFNYALTQGYIPQQDNIVNPCEILPEKRVKGRWTPETYKATYAVASNELKNAMDLALYTAFGMSELVSLKWDELSGNAIEKIRRKTGVQQHINMGDGLLKVIENCRNTGVKSPYVLHKKPKNIQKKSRQSKERTHHTQWTAQQLRRALNKAKSQSGCFTGVPTNEQPGWHSIRALAAFRLMKQGVKIEEIQKLLGHSDLQTTKVYLKGHEDEKIESYAILDEF